MTTRTPVLVEDHHLGGKMKFYELEDGRFASVLDSGYEFADDFEIQVWDSLEPRSIVLGSERRVSTAALAMEIVGSL